MVSHVRYNLDANEGFLGFIYFQLHYVLYDVGLHVFGFISGMDSDRLLVY